jgi:hypothetical protein
MTELEIKAGTRDNPNVATLGISLKVDSINMPLSQNSSQTIPPDAKIKFVP